MGVLQTWEVGEIVGNPQSQSKKCLKEEVKKKGGGVGMYGTGCLRCYLFPPPSPLLFDLLFIRLSVC